MTKASSIRSVETLSCDAGWRNYHFVKVMTEDGIVGWSEFDEGFGSPGVGASWEGSSWGGVWDLSCSGAAPIREPQPRS